MIVRKVLQAVIDAQIESEKQVIDIMNVKNLPLPPPQLEGLLGFHKGRISGLEAAKALIESVAQPHILIPGPVGRCDCNE